MAGKKASKTFTIKRDPVKETARDVLGALIASNENEDGLDTIKKAYEIAEAFENYEI